MENVTGKWVWAAERQVGTLQRVVCRGLKERVTPEQGPEGAEEGLCIWFILGCGVWGGKQALGAKALKWGGLYVAEDLQRGCTCS